MTEDILPVLLASSLVAAIVGGLIAGWVSLRVTRNQYVNDYYRVVVQKRIAAYEALENLIVMLKNSVVDESDQSAYHLLFAQEDPIERFQLLYNVSAQSLWLSDYAAEQLIAFNRLIYQCSDKPEEIIAFGKKHYRSIADMRSNLEKTLAKDFLSLHDVRQFLKSKKPSDSYQSIPQRG